MTLPRIMHRDPGTRGREKGALIETRPTRSDAYHHWMRRFDPKSATLVTRPPNFQLYDRRSAVGETLYPHGNFMSITRPIGRYHLIH